MRTIMSRRSVVVLVMWVMVVVSSIISSSMAQAPTLSCSGSTDTICGTQINPCWRCSINTCTPINLSPAPGGLAVTVPQTTTCADKVWGWGSVSASTNRTDCTYLTQPLFRACESGQVVVGFSEFACATYATQLGNNAPSCVLGCNSTTACIRGSNYTGVNDRPDRVCLNNVIANPSSSGCGVSTAAPCSDWLAGVSDRTCLRYTTTSRGFCRANTTLGWCDTSASACAAAGVATTAYQTCGSAQCVNTAACPNGASVSSAGDVCLRNVPQSGCGSATDCSAVIAGWDPSNNAVCRKYSDPSVPAFCDGESTCRSGVDVCAGGATEPHITCSPGCRRLCDADQPVSAFTLSQVCYTDFTQHDCGSGLVCGANGQCQALPPVIPPTDPAPPLDPPASPPTGSSAPSGAGGSPSSSGGSPTSSGGVPSSSSAPTATSAPSATPSSNKTNAPKTSSAGLKMLSFPVVVLIVAAILLFFGF